MTQTVIIELDIHDGTRRPIPDGTKLWVTLQAFRMGKAEVVHQEYYTTPLNPFPVEYLNAGDMFTAQVNPDGYSSSGFGPFRAEPGKTCRVGLMTLPKTRRFNFDSASWDLLKKNEPDLFRIISFSNSESEEAMRERYDALIRENPLALAAILNILTAVKDMRWNVADRQPIDFFKGLVWERGELDTLQQDRFYAWAEYDKLKGEGFLDAVKKAAKAGEFAPSPKGPHKGATVTYKQTRFMTADVQFSFQESETEEIGGKTFSMVELDIDYYSDKFTHMVELIGNLKGDTNPMKVYVLRWAEGEFSGVPFNPPLTVVA